VNQSDATAVAFCRWFARPANVTAFAVGTLVLVAWARDMMAKNVSCGLMAMKPDSAVGKLRGLVFSLPKPESLPVLVSAQRRNGG
jgi:hypothetical protein